MGVNIIECQDLEPRISWDIKGGKDLEFWIARKTPDGKLVGEPQDAKYRIYYDFSQVYDTSQISPHCTNLQELEQF